MSNFIYGKLTTNDITQLFNSKIDFFMIEYAVQNNFAVHFSNISVHKKNSGNMFFAISDNFFVNYCEYFLEPIIYTADGTPLLENLCKDLEKLYGLIKKMFEFGFVKEIELKFSYVEVDEDEYDTCMTSIENFKDTIIQKYKSTIGFPVIRVIVKKKV